MQKLACIRVHPRKGAPAIPRRTLEDWAESFALFGRSAWVDESAPVIYVESHGRLSLYGGPKGWAETLRGFAQGLGLHASIVVGFRPEPLRELARPGVRILVMGSRAEERERALSLPRPAAPSLAELGPLWARIA